MTSLKEKIYNIFDIIIGDKGFMYHCNPETLDAIADLAKILLDEDLIIGNKKVLRKKLKVDNYKYNEEDEYTVFKTGIYCQRNELTELAEKVKEYIEKDMKEDFIYALENEFLNEDDKTNE